MNRLKLFDIVKMMDDDFEKRSNEQKDKMKSLCKAIETATGILSNTCNTANFNITVNKDFIKIIIKNPCMIMNKKDSKSYEVLSKCEIIRFMSYESDFENIYTLFMMNL